jgi:D-aspartate ligase
MAKYDNIAIVLGGGMNGLGITRNLGRNGVHVYCVIDNVNEVIFSRYCEKYFLIPHIRENKDVLRSFLNKLGKNLNDYAILFPTSDIHSFHLSDFKDELEDNYRVLLPISEVVKTLVDKKRLYFSLSENKVPHPATFFPESLEEIKAISKDIKYPVFIKPSISPIFHQKFGKKGFKANTEDELIYYYLLASKHRIEVGLQEVIPGPDDFIYGIAGYFDKNSFPKAFFAYRRIRGWPPTFGTNSLMESIPISNVTSIKEITECYLRKLGYHGIMEAEFKRDPRDDIFKLLEINARSWWQNSFPSKCGINIVFIAYLDSIGKELQYIENYEPGIKWAYFLNDLRSSISTSCNMTLTDWITSLKGIKDWAFFSIDDPLPWITHNFFTFYGLLKSFNVRTHKSFLC